MTGKINDLKTELRVITSLFDGKSDVSALLIAEAIPSFFGYKPAKLIFKRALRIFEKRGRLPSRQTAAQDPALPKECQVLLEKSRQKPIESKDDAKAALDQLRHWRKIRLYFDASREITDAISSGQLDEEKFSELESKVDSLFLQARSKSDAKLYTAGAGGNKLADEVMKRILFGTEKRLIPTGVKTFDDRTGGAARGNVIVVAASSGGGKSVMGMQMGINQYLDHNLNVAIVSLEMDEEEYQERVIVNLSGIEYEKIHSQKHSVNEAKRGWKAWKRFKEHGKRNNCKFTIFPAGALSTTELQAQLHTGNYDVWIIDYLNLLNPEDSDSGSNEARQLGNMARILKLTASRLGVLIVLLTQINDDFQVKYSRAVREHCNFLWKWQYDEDAEATGIAKVIQDKARGGKKYPFQLMMEFEYMTIRDMPLNEESGTYANRGGDTSEGEEDSKKSKDGKKFTRKREQPVRRMRGL